MIRQMKNLSVQDSEHGEVIALDDFLRVLRQELHKFGIVFDGSDNSLIQFMNTDDAIAIAAEVLQSSALTQMEKHGFTAMLPQHA